MQLHDARAAVARCARRLWERGLVTGSSGNVSARVDDGSLIVTPSGRSLAELEPGDLVHVANDGTALDTGQRPTSELPLHVAAYRARREIACVVHAHPTFCVVWAGKGRLFPLDTVAARESLGPIALVEYVKPGSSALGDAVAKALRDGASSVLLARHGLLAVGETFDEAFERVDLAEEIAKVEFYAAQLR